MTGLLFKKYHVAILDSDTAFVSKAMSLLKRLYNNKIVVKTYTDPHAMFMDMNSYMVKKCPFDLTILGPKEVAEKMILNQSNPDMKVLLCTDETILKHETSKLLI